MFELIRKLEKKFGRYAIPDLYRYVVAVYAVGLLILIINPTFYYQYLCLNTAYVLKGQIWRLITFLFYPPEASSLIFALLFLVIYYQFGMALERVWGRVRFNMYIFSGILLHIIAAFLVALIQGNCVLYGASYLSWTMLLAFITEFPDTTFYLMFFIPVKAKWLGIVYAVYMGLMIVLGFASLLIPNSLGFTFTNAVMAFVSILNYVLYYLSGPGSRHDPRKVIRRQQFERKAAEPVRKAGGTIHRCAVCGRTEADDGQLEFRYCSKCNGNFEYCKDHLYTHMHVE